MIFSNGSERKEAPLRDLVLEVETQWVYLRLLHDQKGLSIGQFEVLGKRLIKMIQLISSKLIVDSRQTSLKDGPFGPTLFA